MSDEIKPADGIKPKSNRGGARPGAGRKPKLELTAKAKKRLTVKQQRFISEKLKGKTHTQAARDAGYKESTALVAGRDVLANPNVQSEFQRLLSKIVPAEKVVLRIAEGLDAKQTKFFQYEGKMTDQVDCVDFSERRAYAELVCKVQRFIPQDDMPQAFPDIQVNIIHVGAPSR